MTVFGPRSAPTNRQYWRNVMAGATAQTAYSMGCNCIGPQVGEVKCPCMLSAEMKQGRKMVEEGVTVNGKRYKLVPEGDGI